MNLTKYLNLNVKILLNNNYYYVGKVTSTTENSLELIDIKGNLVSLSSSVILTIQEIKGENQTQLNHRR